LTFDCKSRKKIRSKVLKKWKVFKVRKKVTKLNKLIYFKFILSKFILENLLYKVLNIPNSILLQNSYYLLKYNKPLLFLNYKIFNKLHYLRRSLYFIDAINILSFGLRYKLPLIILYFIINELHKTPKHRLFLNNLSIIFKLFIELSIIYEGFKLTINGPIGKHGRTKIFTLQIGILQIQSYVCNVTYAISFSITKFGSLGIRLWIT
jgi:hypothetical protein